MGKKEQSDKVTLIIHSHPLPKEHSQLSSSIVEKSMIRSRLTIPQPKLPKSPGLLAICGRMLIKQLKSVLKHNIKRTKKLLLNKKQSTKKNSVKLSARRKRKELKKKTSKNDSKSCFICLLLHRYQDQPMILKIKGFFCCSSK
jgi:hypothetical protein